MNKTKARRRPRPPGGSSAHRAWCTIVVLLMVALIPVDAAHRHISGIQSGKKGEFDSSYASSMVYNSKSHRVFVTGATHGNYFNPSAMSKDEDETSDCFVGILQLPVRNEDVDPVWLRRVKIGAPQVSESCSDIYTIERETTRDIYLTGHSVGSPGILSSIYPEILDLDPRTMPSVYGMLLDLNWSADLKGGRLLYSDTVQYPVAITADPSMRDLFVATSTSSVADMNPAYEAWANLQNNSQIDSTTAGGYLPPAYGQNFAANIQKLNTTIKDRLVESDSLHETLKTVWGKQFGRDSYIDGFSVQMSSLLYVSDQLLVVAGSTRGNGPFLGETNGDESLDGTLTVLNPSTGDLVVSKRVQSPDNGTDRILSMCRSSNSSSTDIYIVGMTENNLNSDGQDPALPVQVGSFQAFIQKVNAETLDVMWTYQLGAYLADNQGFNEFLPQLHGLACAATTDGEHVYLAGTAKDGATISLDGSTSATSSAGKDDIFVAQLQTSTGNLVWVQQLGTREDDSLAHGKGLACDKDGHAILLGNTRGSFLREKQSEGGGSSNDILVLTLDRTTGEYKTLLDHATVDDTRDEVNEDAIPESDIPDTGPELIATQGSSEAPNPAPTAAPVTNEDADEMVVVLALSLLISVVAVSLCMLLYFRHKRVSRKKEVDRQVSAVNGTLLNNNLGNAKDSYFDGNTLWRENIKGSAPHYLDEAEADHTGSTERDHMDDMSFSSGITLRPMTKQGVEELNKDTLLHLEPTSEPYTVNSPQLFGHRASSQNDPYDVLNYESPCMSTAGEGSASDLGMEEDGLLQGDWVESENKGGIV